MATILNTTEELNELNELEVYFEKNVSPSFHNFLWQFIVNKIHNDEIVCVWNTYPSGEFTNLALIRWNEGGYTNLGVIFADIKPSIMNEVCYIINSKLFGINEKLTDKMVGISMFKPVSLKTA